MKKLLFAAALIIPFLANAQTSGNGYKTEDKYLYYGDVVKVDTTFTVSDLYKDAKLFITKLALTNTNITTDDKTGTVIADVQEPTTFKSATGLTSENMTLKYTIKLELKKGRYRYTFDNIIINYAEDDRSTPHALYDVDRRSSGTFGNRQARRVLKAMDELMQRHIDLLTQTMSKRSDDF